MKKLIIILTVAIAICAMSVSTLAAWDGFIESPSANGAPTIVEGNSDDGVRISAYRDRADILSSDQIVSFENAYKSIVGFASVPDLNANISDIANSVKVNPSDLAISDLFYVSIDGSKTSAMTSLKSITFDNFVCLLRYDGSNWVVVEAKMTGDDIIEFDAVSGSYAVVVSTGATPDHGGSSGCNKLVGIIALICIVISVVLAVTFVFQRKAKSRDEQQ